MSHIPSFGAPYVCSCWLFLLRRGCGVLALKRPLRCVFDSPPTIPPPPTNQSSDGRSGREGGAVRYYASDGCRASLTLCTCCCGRSARGGSHAALLCTPSCHVHACGCVKYPSWAVDSRGHRRLALHPCSCSHAGTSSAISWLQPRTKVGCCWGQGVERGWY